MITVESLIKDAPNKGHLFIKDIQYKLAKAPECIPYSTSLTSALTGLWPEKPAVLVHLLSVHRQLVYVHHTHFICDSREDILHISLRMSH